MAIKTTRRLSLRFSVRPVRPRPLCSRTSQAKWHWLDHPEMQARIAEAEADRAAGRVTRGNSLEELMAQLRAIGSSDEDA